MSQTMEPTKKRPSERWTSYEDWDYNGMKERLEGFMASLKKTALVEHAEQLLESPVSMSESFSAGQHWCCFELVASNGRLVIARVRLPKHPDSNVDENAEEDLIRSEVATMKFLQNHVMTVPVPTLYASELPGSPRAVAAGAAYMLIEGFHGNSLQDANHDMYNLPAKTQERIITQNGCRDGSSRHSPDRRSSYRGAVRVVMGLLRAVADARFGQAIQKNADSSNKFATLGPFLFRTIVHTTALFKDDRKPFHFSHMDMGMQNLLVDDDFEILAVIDWEMAQSAPWEVIHYPMPFPLISSDEETAAILQDPSHLAHRNVSRQVAARKMYRDKFKEAEEAYPLPVSIAEILDGSGSRIYGVAEKIGVWKGREEELTYELVRLAYGLVGPEADQHLERLEAEMRQYLESMISRS
ncbi:hypothetical protein QBC46DRAFT_378825 [Diplogelasinospora grovesii]|uniref:Aminoglycoside phosphotransferase domain-containing protein n=1 Tax=Diplogelasinospora grovesii TaxID=303347 RepID=A0AAN6S6L8_9PEZI|nr:hypothetical protein QBC46DRAFT_378825 [Diplogelasinospora grovesii]